MSRLFGPLRQMGYVVPESHANFVWLPLRERTTDFAVACESKGVIVRPFAGDGVRVTIGSPEENDRFLELARSLA